MCDIEDALAGDAIELQPLA